MRSVAVVLFDQFAVFEFAVICEVFGIDREDSGVPRTTVRVCGERPGAPLRSATGVLVTPEHGLDAAEDADVVAVPGAPVEDSYSPAVLDTLRATAAREGTLLSVCTGAFLLGAAGLLDGRLCTTHWMYADTFTERFPEAKLDPDVLFVDDGDIITSAGTAAGIDACLHLVRRELGAGAANAIARRMVVPPQREGGQRQFVESPVAQYVEGNLAPVLDWLLGSLHQEHTVVQMARRAQMSERTFARRFLAETGTTPHRWLSTQRVLRARRLLEDTNLSIDEVAQECGFGSAALLRHHFSQIVGVSPREYRRTFAH